MEKTCLKKEKTHARRMQKKKKDLFCTQNAKGFIFPKIVQFIFSDMEAEERRTEVIKERRRGKRG